MKYPLTLFILVFLTCSSAFAKNSTITADTTTTGIPHKQSQQYFLDNYGKNDSTRALINYFFKKRKSALYETVLPPIIGGVSIPLLDRLSVGANSYGNAPATLALAVVIYVGSTYFIAGQINWLVYSRKRLLTILENYNSGIPIPRGLTRRNLFRSELGIWK